MTVPTRWRLAQHWAASPERETFAPMLEDLGAPCCFACGWHSERWAKEETHPAAWQRATLERAHIVPSSRGGSDEASNVILLCAQCHRDSPDWPDPSEMARWIAECSERSSKELEEVGHWLEALRSVPEFMTVLADLEANPDLSDEEAVRRIVDMLWESTLKGTTHVKKISSGTRAAILRDTAARAAAK